MAVNNKLDRRHDINKGEKLPERHTRVLDEEAYREGIERVLNNTEAPVTFKMDVVKAGDLVWVGGHIEEVEKVLDDERMIVLIRGSRVGGCVLLPSYVQEMWAKARLEMGI
jgi:hypothetical protein